MTSHFYWGRQDRNELSNMNVILHKTFLCEGTEKTVFVAYLLCARHCAFILIAFSLYKSTLTVGITGL